MAQSCCCCFFFFTNTGSKRQHQTLQPTPEKCDWMSRDNLQMVEKQRSSPGTLLLMTGHLPLINNIGFQHLPSSHHIAGVMLLRFHDFVKKHINFLLQDISATCFITNVWSSIVSLMSLISLTAQWISEDFTTQRVALHVKQFQGSNTSRTTAGAFDYMLQTWDLLKSVADAVAVRCQIVGHFEHSPLTTSAARISLYKVSHRT